MNIITAYFVQDDNGDLKGPYNSRTDAQNAEYYEDKPQIMKKIEERSKVLRERVRFALERLQVDSNG